MGSVLEEMMPDSPSIRLAVFTDLHIGATTRKRWHNQFLSDHPETTASQVVDQVNRAGPDIAIITGDLTDTSSNAELVTARSVLDRLNAPWIVCRGNHDVTEAEDRTPFERVFSDRTAVGLVASSILPLPDGVAMIVFDAEWRTESDQWRVFVPDRQLQSTLAALDAHNPDVLIAICHFPFVRQSEYVREQSPNGEGKNAGTLWDGEQTLERLVERAGYTLALTGHQHFHHITSGAAWLHCTTASLVEYPAEYRIIDIRDGRIEITTHPGAPDLIAENPPQVTWVQGREEDRAWIADIRLEVR